MRPTGLIPILGLAAWTVAAAVAGWSRPTEPGPQHLGAIPAPPAAAARLDSQPAVPALEPPATLGRKDFYRGMALGLHSQEVDFDYRPMLREIHDLGADWVALFFSLDLEKADSTAFRYPKGEAQQMAILQRTVREAHALGLKTLIFPITLLSNPGKGEWRGSLAPADRALWHRNYRALITRLARQAQIWQCEGLSIGSEFCSMEFDEAEWRQTISTVRQVYDGQLTYSANWDHYDPVKYWDALDLIAITGYYELSKDSDPDLEMLMNAWRSNRRALIKWYANMNPKKPIIFSEIGYPNQDGCNMYPWDYTRQTKPDPAEQALCYEAFIRTWDKSPELGGVFFYNWWYDPWHYTTDSANDPGYSPRGKPAEQHVRRWYDEITRSSLSVAATGR